MALILTLTLNPAVDHWTSTPVVVPDRKLRCAPGCRSAGGGGVNIAQVARRLGHQAVAIFPAGGPAGEALTSMVRSEGVTALPVPIEGETRENLTVIDETSRAEYRFVLPGPRLKGRDWMACLRTLAEFEPRPAFICASGSLPRGVPTDFYARVAEIAADWGVRLALDTSGPALKAAIGEHVAIIKPNLEELRELAPGALDDEASLIVACRGLIAQGRTCAVALTLGADGALLVTEHEVWRAGPLAIQPISTVGAGDSFLAAMVCALSVGRSYPDALREASAAGAAALLQSGAELCTPKSISRLREQVVVTQVKEAASASS